MTEAQHTQLRDQARRLYDQPPRAYHNWAHVEACLREFEPVRSQCVDPQAVELAIWLHDCIYDSIRHDNEQRSADEAESALRAAGANDSLVATVRTLILDTCHTADPIATDGALLVDIDLSTLGQDRETYDRYEQAIRQEYAHVPAEAFRKGRAAILQSFLTKPRIYRTDGFLTRYETAARANLQRAIEQLGHGAA